MSSSSDSDPILVSYHDSIVRASNLRTLDNSNWLDDNIISFAFEYLQHDSKYPQVENFVQLLSPPVVQLLKMTDDDFAQSLLESIGFTEKRFLIIPINDNNRVNVFGGSHWSLLILDIPAKNLYHFDSASPSNDQTAEEIQGKFRTFFHQPIRLIKASSPQQTNGYDCGLYLIAIAEAFWSFINEYASSGKLEEKNLFETFSSSLHRSLTPPSIRERRKQLKSLLESMRKNK